MSKQMRAVLLGAALGVMAVLSGAACGGGDTAAADRTVAVVMRDVAFDTQVVEARVGERVEITFRNEGAVTHDFTVTRMPVRGMAASGGLTSGVHGAHASKSAAVHLALGAGGRGSVRFTATEAGEYEYVCTEPGHLDAGMRGVIRVTG